jgi:hypothetical protein
VASSKWPGAALLVSSLLLLLPEWLTGAFIARGSLIARNLVIGCDDSFEYKNVSTIPHQRVVKLCNAV